MESVLNEMKIMSPYPLEQDVSSCHKSEISRITDAVTAPVITSYVWWILHEALKEKIDVIYFLARDGQILYKIAKLLCDKFALSIDCRYLYCSRMALRMPTYHFIGDEAYDLLTIGGYDVTPLSLLQRVGFTLQERQTIYRDCGMEFAMEKVRLSHSELGAFSEKLRKSTLYCNVVQSKSKAAWPLFYRYLQQEGLLEKRTIGLVDSGWTGSMQRSLRQALEYAGTVPNIHGYYFGMYAKPKEQKDGIYQTWYFNHTTHKRRKVNFCNNLFECMLSADHGMTTGYREEGTKIVPILRPPPHGEMQNAILEQQNAVMKFVQYILEGISFTSFDSEKHAAYSEQLLRQLMRYPRLEEVRAFSPFIFSDDILDEERHSLAECSQLDYLKNYLIISRVIRKLASLHRRTGELFWPFGMTAFLPTFRRRWYSWNIAVWEWLKYTWK